MLVGFLGGKRARFLAAIDVAVACGVFVIGRQRIVASHAARGGAGFALALSSCTEAFRGAQPKLLLTLGVLKEQGMILDAPLGLSAFSMAETSITTLWPWKVAILLLTEITPKSIAVHSATEVIRFVISEPYAAEDELKLMLQGAELSGTIEEEQQDMIENVLEIKDTHVREEMTLFVESPCI